MTKETRFGNSSDKNHVARSWLHINGGYMEPLLRGYEALYNYKRFDRTASESTARLSLAAQE